MTENGPVCRATLHLDGQSYDCVLSENHTGPHQDQVTDLATRVGLLEAAWTVGGETLSERLDRIVLGITEQLRTTTQLAQAVCIDPSDLSGLLRDREELHALRNAAQADVVAVGRTGCMGPCCE